MLLKSAEIKLIHVSTLLPYTIKDMRLMQQKYDPKFPIYVLTKPKLIRIDRVHPAFHNR